MLRGCVGLVCWCPHHQFNWYPGRRLASRAPCPGRTKRARQTLSCTTFNRHRFAHASVLPRFGCRCTCILGDVVEIPACLIKSPRPRPHSTHSPANLQARSSAGDPGGSCKPWGMRRQPRRRDPILARIGSSGESRQRKFLNMLSLWQRINIRIRECQHEHTSTPLLPAQITNLRVHLSVSDGGKWSSQKKSQN